jgi:dipeptidyl aminopeptidase/acylaminoacyl peptidase
VALALAARLPLAGVAALCGIADLADPVSRAARFLPDYVAAVTSALGRPEDDPAAYAVRSPVTWIDRIRCPLLLVAGGQDRVCPAYQTELLAEAARAHGLPVDRHIVPGAGHFFETRAATGTARPHVLAVITAWLAALVEKPAPGPGPSVRPPRDRLLLDGPRLER